MAVFRIEKTRDYTVMSNYHLRDRSLSLKAKGLLSLMLSLPEDWDYTMKGLARICKDGIDSISGGIRELEAHATISRHARMKPPITPPIIKFNANRAIPPPREPPPGTIQRHIRWRPNGSPQSIQSHT